MQPAGMLSVGVAVGGSRVADGAGCVLACVVMADVAPAWQADRNKPRLTNKGISFLMVNASCVQL